MITGQATKGIQVSLVELAPGAPPTWLANAPGVSYRSLNCTSKVHYPLAVRKLARFLNKESVDILHTHLFFAGIIGVLTKWLQRGTTVVLMRHHTSVVRMLGWGIHIAADKWMAENADHVITVSEAARKYMREVDGIRRADIEVVYIGFDFENLARDPEKREQLRGEFGFGADDIVLGYVATYVQGKGHLQLLDAFHKIAADIPNARILLVGSPAGMLGDIRSAASEFPPGSVVLEGWRDDVAACLSSMDIFIQPSLSEAFSRVIIEAMGAGLPVIATRVGGAEEVIEDGVNGILIPPDDPEAIYRAALRLWGDSELRDAIARRGMISVRERFTADQMVDRLIGLYKSWVNE